MKVFLSLSLILLTSSAFSQINKIYDTKSLSYISINEFLSEIDENTNFIIGENHNTQSIQKAESELISLLRQHTQKKIAFFWEFLNIDDNELSKGLKDLQRGKISIDRFLKKHTLSNNKEYTPLIETLLRTQSLIFPANISRKIKQNIIRNGINSIDQKLIPENHYLSGANYYSRFKEVMGHHTSPEMLDKYYEVQCLVDSIMAQAYRQHHDKISILLSGSFHTDYYDGVFEKINNQLHIPPISIKITNDLTSINQEDKYGNLADFILLTD